MPDPGDVVGQAVVNVRTCEQSNPPCMDDYPENVWLCPGCQGDGTYNAEQVERVEPKDSPFVVVGRDNPEGPSLVARTDGYYPVGDKEDE
jgi:hypothetical protein